jgi:hypothetical protein
MVIHINQDTVHIGLKGVTWAANVVGWSGGVGGGVCSPGSITLYPILGSAAGIHCYVCMLNDLKCTICFCKTSYL